MSIIDQKLKEKRLEICKTCEFYNEREIYSIIVKKCKACGCNLDAKALMTRMKCPKGKW